MATLLSTTEAAVYIGISRSMIYKLIGKKRFPEPMVKKNRVVLYEKDSLRYLREKYNKKKSEAACQQEH